MSSMMTLNKLNRNILVLPIQNLPLFGVRNLFHPDFNNGNKQEHTQELLTTYKKEIPPTFKGLIEEDDYDLLACPPENLIHPHPDKTQKQKESS